MMFPFAFLLQAKPLLEQGAIERLVDPQLKLTPKNSNQVSRMIQAAAACINSEESRRPNIDEIIAIIRGEESDCPKRMKSSTNGCIVDCYPQLQQTRSEMTSHLALAMLGVSEFEDDDHLYYR